MSRLPSVWKLFLATLREIFDEAAYARYLEREMRRPDSASFGAFITEHRSPRNKPRCC